jgi:hypothetical protein
MTNLYVKCFYVRIYVNGVLIEVQQDAEIQYCEHGGFFFRKVAYSRDEIPPKTF